MFHVSMSRKSSRIRCGYIYFACVSNHCLLTWMCVFYIKMESKRWFFSLLNLLYYYTTLNMLIVSFNNCRNFLLMELRNVKNSISFFLIKIFANLLILDFFFIFIFYNDFYIQVCKFYIHI